MPLRTNRREFLALASASLAAALAARGAAAQSRAMPTRPIPMTNETLPIVGLGSTRPVTAIAERGPGPVEAVVRALVEHGGRAAPRTTAHSVRSSARPTCANACS